VPLGDARKRSGIAAFFCCGRVDIIRSQTQDRPHLVSKSSGRVPPSGRPPNAGAGPSQRPWHNHGVVPSPHCRLSLPRKGRQLAWQNPKRAPSRHCRLSLPRKDFPRAWHNRTLVVTPRNLPWKTAPGAHPANRKLGVKRGDASVEVSDRSVGHRIERLWPRSRFSARGPGWPACPQRAERFGKRLHVPPTRALNR
jgi:hypothetical protein